MRFVGPLVPDVLVHGVTALGIGALLGGSVLAFLAWRSTASWDRGGDDAHDVPASDDSGDDTQQWSMEDEHVRELSDDAEA